MDITIHKKLKTEQRRTTVKSEKIFTTMLHINRRGSEMENRNHLHCDSFFSLNWSSRSITRYRSKDEADLAVTIVIHIASSMG